MSTFEAVLALVTLLTGLATGVVGTIRYFRRMGSQDRKEAVAAHEQVIGHYQEMVDRLEAQVEAMLKQVAKQEDRIHELEVQVDHLERELQRERRERISGSTDVTLREVK